MMGFSLLRFIIAAISLTVLLVLSAAELSSAVASQPADAPIIRQLMQEINEFLDSAEYAERVLWDEHVVMVYRLGAGRDPSLWEFTMLKNLHKEMKLSRSTVLSIALRGGKLRPGWAACRSFLERAGLSDFAVDETIKTLARRLAEEPQSKALDAISRETDATEMNPLSNLQQQQQTLLPHVEYNTYFGFVHAHSELSDGEGTPLEAYTYARMSGGLDFFALSDHGELLNTWPWEDEWEELVDAAKSTYMPGSFATLWGFEWSSPLYGHITVLNTNDFTDSVTRNSIRDIYNWIVARPESFGHFNHPGDYDDFNEEFSHLSLYPVAISQMVGIETWNGDDSFDRYFYSGGWSSKDHSYWDEGNRKGWHLGALGSQDNHSRNWGTMNQFRTAILAPDLTRESIIEAYRQRRFYATEDKDLYLDFRCQGYPMGTHLSAVERSFEITAWDGDGDTFQEVRLYRDGALLKSKTVTGDRIHIFLDDCLYDGNAAYYYVIVQQNDDNDGNGRNDEAVSSPIWIDAELPKQSPTPWIPLLLLRD
jgi:hypothetical protein